jgi:hypothetical protein
MPVMTGKDGAVSINGGALVGKVTDWKANYTSKNVENDGAGDAVVTRTHLRKDWTVTIEFYVLDQASRILGAALVGTSATFALKDKVSDSNPSVSGTGLYETWDRDHPASDNAKVSITVKCDGTDLTIDETPAS